MDLFKPLTEEEFQAKLDEAAEPPGEGNKTDTSPVMDGDATAVWNMIKDLHLELIFIYHRVCLRLAELGPGIF